MPENTPNPDNTPSTADTRSTADWPDKPFGGVLVPGSEALREGAAAKLGDAIRGMLEDSRLAGLRDEIDAVQWQESVAHSRFAVARTRADLNALLNYGHPIPVSRGRTAAYVEEHFPGWTWNSVTAVLKSAGVFMPGGGRTPYCDPRVGAVHFDSVDSWLVEWEDGTVTHS